MDHRARAALSLQEAVHNLAAHSPMLRIVVLLAVYGASGLEIPLVGGATSDQLAKWVSRAESLVDKVSAADLERYQQNSEIAIKEGRKWVEFAMKFAKENANLFECEWHTSGIVACRQRA